MREHIGLALANLHEVMKSAEAIDTAVERRAGMQALCVQSEANLTRATQELKATQAELGRVSAALKGKARILQDQRDRSNADLDGRISAAQAEWQELHGKIEKARQAIKDTDASTESLIRRLRV
jgi:peptidoglycan hydrolase CwlO-like protein